jgi:hypothetical protein
LLLNVDGVSETLEQVCEADPDWGVPHLMRAMMTDDVSMKKEALDRFLEVESRATKSFTSTPIVPESPLLSADPKLGLTSSSPNDGAESAPYRSHWYKLAAKTRKALGS